MFRSFASTLLIVSLSGTAVLADDNGLPSSQTSSTTGSSSTETAPARKGRSRAERRRRCGRRGQPDPARRATDAKPRANDESEKAHLPQIIRKPVSDDPLGGLNLGR